MTIILDTDVLSELRLPNPDPRAAIWFAGLAGDEIALASSSLAEVQYGIVRADALPPARAAELADRLDAIESTQRILPLDAAAARVLGRHHALPGLRNSATTSPQARIPRFGGELAIAATAVAHRASVATRDVEDYRLIARHCTGLSGMNPWTGETF